jgi:putative transcriptional regulator
MSIKHHLSDGLLMAYTAGSLPEAFDLVVASHLSMCDECRARMESFEAVGGSLIDELDTVDLAEDSLEQTMALIAAEAGFEMPAPRRRAGVFPAPLQDYVGGDVDAVNWRGLGSGVKQAVLPTSNDASVRLLRIPAGARMPDHGHRGIELTMVLQCAFRDKDGLYARGDVEIADEATQHTPIAEEGEDCICIVATDAPLRFNALLPRMAQPFLRI